MTTGIIDVGGGYRDIFGAGVIDALLAHDIHIDHCYGISAGSGNLTSYLSGQYKRSYRFYVEYAFRHKYASMRNYITQGNFVGFDYAYDTLSNSYGEYPLNYEALRDNPSTFTVIASNALTGLPQYFTKDDISQDNYAIIKASSCMPIANRPIIIDDVPYFDGGLTNPVPVARAFADGCDRVILILSHPENFVREQKYDLIPAQLISLAYPEISKALMNRSTLYNEQVELAHQYARDGKLIIIAPQETFGLNTLKKTRIGLIQMYQHGFDQVERVLDFLGGER